MDRDWETMSQKSERKKKKKRIWLQINEGVLIIDGSQRSLAELPHPLAVLI